MSDLSSFLSSEEFHRKPKPRHTANIRGPKRIGTTDDDEGRRGLHRHAENDEDGRVDQFEDEGLRDDRHAN